MEEIIWAFLSELFFAAFLILKRSDNRRLQVTRLVVVVSFLAGLSSWIVAAFLAVPLMRTIFVGVGFVLFANSFSFLVYAVILIRRLDAIRPSELLEQSGPEDGQGPEENREKKDRGRVDE